MPEPRSGGTDATAAACPQAGNSSLIGDSVAPVTPPASGDTWIGSDPRPTRAAYTDVEEVARRLDHALAGLEQAIDDVQLAGRRVAEVHGSTFEGFSFLDLVQVAVRHARARRAAHDVDPDTTAYTEATRKTRQAQDALWHVRKSLRKAPAAAVERLAAVDLEGVDPQLVQQVYGEWLRQCARLGLRQPYKYHAAFGQGAVLVRCAGTSHYRVVSAIGLPGWAPGTVVPPGDLPGLQPLR